MSVPFIIWTLRRTGGTTFSNLLIELSGRPRFKGEPFNWDRELGWISAEFEQTRSDGLLRDRLREVLAPGPVFKHAYDVVSDRMTPILMEAATDAGYRHVLLSRADEAARILSLHTAYATGHWGNDATRAVYDEFRTGARALPPFDIPALIDELHNSRQQTAQVEANFNRLGIDPLRVDFASLYANPEAGRAVMLELLDALSIRVNNIDNFNDRLSIALTSRGQKSAGVYRAVPNYAEARQALNTEIARLPTHTTRIVMQQCVLPAAAEDIVLRIDSPLLPNRELYLDDAAGRALLAVMCRTERHGGREVTRLVVSHHEASGHWGAPIIADLPDGRVEGPLTLAFGWGRFQLRSAKGVILGFDPTRTFGGDSVPPKVAAMRTNFDLRLMTLQTGGEVARQLAHGDRFTALTPAGGDGAALRDGITLLWLARGPDLHTRRAQAEVLAPSFDRVEVVDAFAEGGTADDAIAAAIARVGTRQVMVLSGGWTAEQITASAALAQGVPQVFMPLNHEATFRAGLRWGMVLPTRHAGRPVLSVMAGLVMVDPAFLALADWRLPAGETPALDLAGLRAAMARLPFALRRDGGTMQQPPRPTRHPLVVTEGAGLDPRLPAAGLRQVDLTGGDGLATTLPGFVARARALLDGSCGDDLLLMAQAGGGAAPLAVRVAGLCLRPQAEVAAGPDGLRLSPEMLALIDDHLSGAAAASDLGEVLTASHRRLDDLIGALTEVARRMGFEVVGLTASAAALPPLDGPEVEPVWMPPDATLSGLMQRAASPGAEAVIAALRRALDPPAAFARLVVQCVAANVPEVVDVVSNLDLDSQASQRMARMLAILRPTGLLADPELLMAITGRLAGRHYFDEVRALVAGPMRAAGPHTRLALTAADIAASVFDPADRRFTGADPARLLPADLPAGAHLATFGEQLTHYLSARRDWRGLLAVVDLIGPDALTNFSYEHWMMARIGLGITEGTEALIRDGRDAWRLHDWSVRRLIVQLRHRAGDPALIAEAVADMLAHDPEMTPLTADPTPFRLLNGVPGVAPDEIGCVIVARNEFTRLKWLVDYYRTLGVSQIVLIDNMSTDQTIAEFQGQPDIRILQTTEAYRDSRFGVKWHNEVCDRYFQDRWVLTVDADEVLVFDGADRPGAIRDLARRLDAAGEQALATTMIDMYSDVPLDRLDYHPGDSLIEAFPLFDGSGYWFDRTASFPDTTVSGGARIRRFWNARHDPRLPYISMQKVPLVRWHPGFRYLSSTHEMTPCRVATETGALLHFKFLPDFHARAIEEVARAQHYGGAREYRIYAEMLNDPGNGSFRYAGSVHYDGPGALIRAGLMVPQGGVPAMEQRLRA